MNKWKIAFFLLAGAILSIVAILFYFVVKPVEQVDIPSAKEEINGGVLTVQTTTEEFEAIAKKYLKDEMKNASLPVELTVEDDIQIESEVAVFYTNIPITMHFEPIIDEDGNIHLKQTKMNVGRLNIPPETTLKLMRDSIEFPSWIVVRPNEAELFVDLSRLKIASGSRVRAKKLDLANNQIQLEIIVPTK